MKDFFNQTKKIALFLVLALFLNSCVKNEGTPEPEISQEEQDKQNLETAVDKLKKVIDINYTTIESLIEPFNKLSELKKEAERLGVDYNSNFNEIETHLNSEKTKILSLSNIEAEISEIESSINGENPDLEKSKTELSNIKSDLTFRKGELKKFKEETNLGQEDIKTIEELLIKITNIEINIAEKQGNTAVEDFLKEVQALKNEIKSTDYITIESLISPFNKIKELKLKSKKLGIPADFSNEENLLNSELDKLLSLDDKNRRLAEIESSINGENPDLESLKTELSNIESLLNQNLIDLTGISLEINEIINTALSKISRLNNLIIEKENENQNPGEDNNNDNQNPNTDGITFETALASLTDGTFPQDMNSKIKYMKVLDEGATNNSLSINLDTREKLINFEKNFGLLKFEFEYANKTINFNLTLNTNNITFDRNNISLLKSFLADIDASNNSGFTTTLTDQNRNPITNFDIDYSDGIEPYDFLKLWEDKNDYSR